MSDYFLSDLQALTTDLLDTDLWHIRTVGNIDYKVEGEQVQAYLKSPGHFRMVFANMGFYDDGEPVIQAGSEIAIQGATKELVQFASPTSATGWTGMSTNNYSYMKITPAGVASYTATAPTWSSSKHGWYDANDRYVMRLFKVSNTQYTQKQLLINKADMHFEFPLGSLLSPYLASEYVGDPTTKPRFVLTNGQNYYNRAIYIGSLVNTADTATPATMYTRLIVCEGDFINPSGKKIIFQPVEPVNDENDSRDIGNTLQSNLLFSGRGAKDSGNNDGHGGGGAFGGYEGADDGGVARAGAGGGSYATTGGNGGGIALTGGSPALIRTHGTVNFGGNGGRGESNHGGGGGAGPCGGGGSGYGLADAGGNGGPIIFIIVKGKFINAGVIECDGEDGTVVQDGGGGGGGGLVVIVAYGGYSNTGSITARGGNSPSAGVSDDGGGGGGGHIEVYNRGEAAGTLTVTGGTGYIGGSGGTGTTNVIDISSNDNGLAFGEGGSGNQPVGLVWQFLAPGKVA